MARRRGALTSPAMQPFAPEIEQLGDRAAAAPPEAVLSRLRPVPGVYAWWIGPDTRAAASELGAVEQELIDRPLYVGMSANLAARIAEHLSGSQMMKELYPSLSGPGGSIPTGLILASRALDRFLGRALGRWLCERTCLVLVEHPSARAVEAAALRALSPLANRTGTGLTIDEAIAGGDRLLTGVGRGRVARHIWAQDWVHWALENRLAPRRSSLRVGLGEDDFPVGKPGRTPRGAPVLEFPAAVTADPRSFLTARRPREWGDPAWRRRFGTPPDWTSTLDALDDGVLMSEAIGSHLLARSDLGPRVA